MAAESPQAQPVRRADALRSGTSDWALRRKHVALFRGIHVDATAPVTLLMRVEAALVVSSAGSYVSHHTAGRLWGGIVPDDPDIHVTSARSRTRRRGIAAHRAKKGQTVVLRHGFRTTSPVQTFLDLAQRLVLVDLVVFGDSLVKAGRTTPSDLQSAAQALTGPYSQLARQAAALVRSGVDSAMETRLRLLIVLAGLPEQTVDHRVHDASGRLLYRFDLAYPEWGLIIEYDGRQHAESSAQWRADIGRDEQLDDWKVRRLVIVAEDVYRTPARTLSRITKAMQAVGMQVSPLSDEWRRHFPSRPGDLSTPA